MPGFADVSLTCPTGVTEPPPGHRLLGGIAATGALILGSIRLILGRDHPVAILLVDGDLIIHSVAGDRAFVEQLDAAGLGEGRSAAEDAVGTNAVDLRGGSAWA